MKKIFLTLLLLALSTGILAQEGSTAAVDVKSPKGKKATVKDVLEYFVDEPTIQEVQAAAIEYAEVHPDKILKWRKKAKYKAWLPDLSFKYAEDRDTYHWDTWSTTVADELHYEKTRDRSWYTTLNWDLSDLVWNSAQTSIDTRSRLMVQLRNDVLDEVTRTYFERRRLQIEMLLSPPEDMREKIEQELRIQELTADVDALTGGYLSRRVKDAKAEKLRVKKEAEARAREEAQRKAREEREAKLRAEGELKRKAKEEEEARLAAKRAREEELKRKAEEAKEEKVKSYYLEGKRLFREDRYQEAIEQFQKALSLDPNYTRAAKYIERSRKRIEEAKEKKVK